MSNGYIATCMAIAQNHFLNTPYKDVPAFDLYAGDGFANNLSYIYMLEKRV